MRRLLPLLLAAAATPALAQHDGHVTPPAGDPHAGHHAPAPAPAPAADPHAGHHPQAPAPAPVADPHAGHHPPAPAPAPAADPHAGHHPPAPAPAPAPDPHAGHHPPAPAPAPAADPHAGHHPPAPAPAPDPHAGHHPAPAPVADPHAGHGAPAAGLHAGHDMGGEAAPAPPVAPPPPGARSGPAHAADSVYGAEAMAGAREGMRREHGDMRTYRFLFDRLELQAQDGRDGYAWDAEAWYGGDRDKLWLKSEGEGRFGEAPEHAEVQLLFSRAIDPWFHLQAGVRYDLRPDPERAHLVLGIAGLAPYWFEVDGALFLSTKGELTARLEAEYDQRITQRLILQPHAEFDLSAQDVPELGIGAGLSSAEAGLRLRYEFEPEFAPYVGVSYRRAFGRTADFSRAAGEDVGGFSLLVGIRAWF